MAILLIFALVILPISLGAIFILFSRLSNSPTPLHLFILNIGVMIAATLAASFSTSPLRFCFTWQPSAGEMCVSLEKSSLLLILLTSISLLLMIAIYYRQAPKISSQQLGLILISISAANIAFLTEHFLLRYAALEGVGLCIVSASLALSPSGRRAWNNTKLTFLNFRLGDIGLLAAILLFYAHSGTFNISQNFNLAAELPITIRIVLTAGLLSAVWVKMAIWPLDFWADLCSFLPSIMRTWLVDLLMPSLGAYLLYRTSPLLLSNSSISIWVVFIVCISALTKTFFTTTNKQDMSLNRSPLVFSSVCLVVLAALGDQKTLWAFMIFWMFTRLVFLLVSLRQDTRPVPQKTQYLSQYFAAQLLLLGFSMFALWQAALPASISPILIVVLWTTWWMHLIRILRFNFFTKNIAQKRKTRELLRLIFSSLSLAGIIAAALFVIVFILSLLVKGKGIWIIPNRTYFRFFPLISFYFWSSLVLAAFGSVFLVNKTVDFMKLAKKLKNFLSLRKLFPPIKKTDSSSDPLDLTRSISSLFLNIGTFLYKTIEQGSIEKLVKGIQKVFSFLFNKVEKFTSADLWVHALRSVIDSSQKVQRMHPGLLRVNLVWLLLFIIVLVLIAVSPNISSILSTG